MNGSETTKPYTVPEDAPDAALIRCYWQVVRADRRWLAGLRRADGSLYLAHPVDACSWGYTQSLLSELRQDAVGLR
jgi:hypothetical protein